MQYLLGFDCGATKIECTLADVKGKILFNTKKITSANLLVNGADSLSNNLCEIIEDIISSKLIDNEPPEFAAIVIGAAGAGRKNDAENLQSTVTENLNNRGIVHKKILVIGDAQIALETSFPRKPGCILIAGTGSIIYGKNESGKLFRAGGYGRLIGDEGSGYSIGRKALNRASRDFENGVNNSSAIRLLSENYSINSLDELITQVYKNNFDVGAVAEHVISFSEQGAAFAVSILDEESDELVLLIKTMMNKMKIDETEIAFIGSLIDNQNFYSNMLRDKIRTLLKTVTVIDKNSKPVDGAVFIAKELVNA